MTFKEALKAKYPKWSDTLVEDVVHKECPGGYFDEAEPVGGCGPDECGSCWGRQCPEDQIPKGSGTDEPTILDSGSTTEFDTGAHRDSREGKGRCDLIPLEVMANHICDDNDATDWVLWSIREFQKTNSTSYLYSALEEFNKVCWNNMYTMFLEVSKHYEGGAIKYGPDNWKNGMPIYIYIDSAVRHYLKWRRGDKDEPHDRAVVWNLMCCIWEVDYHKREANDKEG